tara:strand:- start:37 stop:546 length:510 start_codon:yes stop_codon:yes gene_type:complete
MNNLDKKAKRDLSKYYTKFSPNGKAIIAGLIGEVKLCEKYGWEKIDADGYDAVALESMNYSIGNAKRYNNNGKVKIEIKTISGNTTTNILAYDSDKKKGRYDYLAIYFYDEERVSLIPHDIFENLINTIGIGKTINLNPGIRHNHSKPIYSPLTQLFLKYEIKDRKYIA